MSRPLGSKNKKEPDFSTCSICGLIYKKQGIGTHIREKHQTVYKREYQEGLKQHLNDKNNASGESIQKVIGKENNSHITKQTPHVVIETDNELISKTESKQNFYSENDVFILQGKLYEIVERYNNIRGLLPDLQLRKDLEAMKEDFFRRFQTNETHIRINYPELFPVAENYEEGMANRAKFLPFARLMYSIE